MLVIKPISISLDYKPFTSLASFFSNEGTIPSSSEL